MTSVTWDEVAKWGFMLLLLIALVILIFIFSGSANELWDKIA